MTKLSSTFKCLICKKPLPVGFGGDYHEKCRQKKSRDKKQAGARAWRIGIAIDKLYESYTNGAMDIHDAIMHHNSILNKVQKLTKQLQEDLNAQIEREQFKAGKK